MTTSFAQMFSRSVDPSADYAGVPEDDEDLCCDPVTVDIDELSAKQYAQAPKRQYHLKTSRFVQLAVRMPKEDGYGYEPFSFEGRRHIIRPYDTNASRVLLICARQVEKSTLLGNKSLACCCMIPSYKILYVSPSGSQTKTFSNDRIKEPIETSPVLKAYTTTLLSQNIYEKQFINRSKITLRSAFLNADRCVSGETRVHFVDGSAATVLDVYSSPSRYVGRKTWAADPISKDVRAAVLTGVVAQGVRATYRVRVTGGAELRCTGNQPLLTWNGWKPLHDLAVGDFVAVPQKLPHGAGLSAPVEEFRFVGYLLGDGSVRTMNAAALHNSNAAVLVDFRHCAHVLGAPLWKEQDSNRAHWVHAETKRQGFGGGRAGYKKRLKELGVIGSSHADKRVPLLFFSGDAQQVGGFLNALFATDGWASVSKNDQYEIGYCSNSKGLLLDVKQLLLRFDVHAILSRQKKPSTENALGAYTLSIRHHDDVLRFASTIGICGKEEALATVVQAARKVRRNSNEHDRVPMPYGELRAYLKNRYGLSTHAAWVQYRIQLRPGNTKDSIGRAVLRQIATKLGDTWLLSLADSSLGWARLEESVFTGYEPTFDLSIDRLENYLSDGIYVHNTRGIPAWRVCIDEVQDILSENIPVIERCADHAPKQWRSFLYSGTPKSLDNTIEWYRANKSTQAEWLVPCDCKGGEGGRYWNQLGEKNIGAKSLICENCGKPLEPMGPEAQWANMVEYDPEKMFESYRISQLMVPWKKWSEIIYDYETMPRAQFYNEVLGLSYDSGLRPLTLGQVRDACNDKITMHPDVLARYRQLGRDQPIFMGVDWGTGENTYTVVTLATYIDMKFRVFYVHRCIGDLMDPAPQVAFISKLISQFNVRVVGTDYGGGYDRNDTLMRKFGPQRLVKFQYMARCRKKVEWDPKLLRFKAHRTEVMSDVFNAIKRHQIELPRWAEFHAEGKAPYAADMLNIFSEYNRTLHMIQYLHAPDKPDDTLHSLVYCLLGSMIVNPRPDIITPRRELPGQGPVFGGNYTPIDQG